MPGMQGAEPLASENKKSPPSPEGKGVGGIGARTKLKAGAAGDQNNRATQQGNAVAGQAGDKEGKPPAGHPISRDSRYRRDIKYGYPPTYYPYSA